MCGEAGSGSKGRRVAGPSLRGSGSKKSTRIPTRTSRVACKYTDGVCKYEVGGREPASAWVLLERVAEE